MWYHRAELIEPGRCWECGGVTMGTKVVFQLDISSSYDSIFKALFGKHGVHELSYTSTSKAVDKLSPAIECLNKAYDLAATPSGKMAIGRVQIFLSDMLLVSEQEEFAKHTWRT